MYLMMLYQDIMSVNQYITGQKNNDVNMTENILETFRRDSSYDFDDS